MEFGGFISALFTDWVTLMSGIFSVLFTILGYIKHEKLQFIKNPEIQRKIYWTLALLCFLFASVRIWTNEHRMLISEHAYLQGRATGFYDYNKPFAMGQPIAVLVTWKNKLSFPAKPQLIYTGVNVLPSNEAEAIEQFKKKWAQELANSQDSKKEFQWIFMDQPMTTGVVNGPILTESMWKRISESQMPLLIISAIRFKDGAGLHEAHMCQYLSQMIGDKLIWGDCNSYITQIDIEQ